MGDIKNGQILTWKKGFEWVPVNYNDKYIKSELIDEFEKNPELFNDIIIEMRNKKINKIKNG